jgi:hypothetical protein
MQTDQTKRCHLLVAFVALLALVGCYRDPRARQEMETQRGRLEGMLSTNATKPQIIAELGTNNFYYQKGEQYWYVVERFVERRTEAKKRLGGHSRVLYYTTADVMTWIFLDDQERIASFYLCWQ